jgi:quercetin dioxygenase-like cupin family protein
LEPLIRNIKDVYEWDGRRARLVQLSDNPPTCTLSYSEIPPGSSSSHHIHPWEHEVYIIKGSGTLVCDSKEYPVKQGDAIFIPPNTDHYTLNNGGQGDIHRIEVNPLIAAQSGGGGNQGGQGTGQPPVIRNLSEIDTSDGPARRILSAEDGATNYIMAYRGLDPGSNAPRHAHPGEHMGFVIQGGCILQVDGKDYEVEEGDVALVPPNAEHEWRSNSDLKAAWLVFNPA